MNQQINLRLPPKLIKDAQGKAKAMGFGTIQAYIEQTIREDIYDDYVLTKKESELIERVVKASHDPRFRVTEEEHQELLRKKRLEAKKQQK